VGHGHGLPYFAGAQFIHFLLGPAVVALAWPLWAASRTARALGALYRGGGAGRRSRTASAVGLAWVLGLPAEVVLSLAPKSVTAPVAMGIADKVGGIASLAAVFAVLTGLVGALSGKALFALLGIGQDATGWMARGFALGTRPASAPPAPCRCTPDAGAWAALALGLQVVVASLLCFDSAGGGLVLKPRAQTAVRNNQRASCALRCAICDWRKSKAAEVHSA
jgi:putative effector of murein hydrolase